MRTQTMHDVMRVAVRSSHPSNGNSLTLQFIRKEWTSEGYVEVQEELVMFFPQRSTARDLLAALPHTEDFVEHQL